MRGECSPPRGLPQSKITLVIHFFFIIPSQGYPPALSLNTWVEGGTVRAKFLAQDIARTQTAQSGDRALTIVSHEATLPLAAFA